MATLSAGVAARIAALQKQRAEAETRAAEQLRTIDAQLAVLERAAKVVENPEVEAVHALLVSAGLISPIK